MQSKKASLTEAFINVLIGYTVAVICNAIILPLYGLTPSIGDSCGIAGVFTAVSLIRSYLLRRLFNHFTITWK